MVASGTNEQHGRGGYPRGGTCHKDEKHFQNVKAEKETWGSLNCPIWQI